MNIIILTFCVVVTIYLIREFWGSNKWQTPSTPFPTDWRFLLEEHVSYYNALDHNEKKRFEYKVQEFLLNCRITGIKTTVEDIDRILIASSAIIPIFHFDKWKYKNLSEVLLYPGAFNLDFDISGPDRPVLGMVGEGIMNGKMILSKSALRYGFSNDTDKKNTALHEFIHLVDKIDGNIDGIPSILMDNQYAIPWLDLINKKIEEIYQNKSDINPYGASNKKEFLAVAGEYFFERPQLLKKKHPELYEMMENAFHQKMNEKNMYKKNNQIGRNAPCPCSSGKKFKHCCGNVHYT